MGYRLIVGDAACKIKELAADSIDLTVTSPPYDGLRTYNGYAFDFEAVAQELYRVMKPGGVVVWVVGDQTIKGSETGTSFRQALYFKSIGFNLHDTMIYEKAQSCYGSRLCYLQAFEYMFVFAKGRPKTIHLLRDRPNKRSGREKAAKSGLNKRGEKSVRKTITLQPLGKRRNIWRFGTGGKKDETGSHPAVFPEQLAEGHILTWSEPGDTVLDPFMGSGTTLKMSVAHGRRYIGIDISPEYVEVSRRRVGTVAERTGNKEDRKG